MSAGPLLAAAAPACVLPCERIRPLEYFHDHVRIESMIFENPIEPADGVMRLDRRRVGHGLVLRRDAVERHRIDPSGR